MSMITGYKGVCFDINKGKFKAYVDMFGVRTSLGYFTNEQDAVTKRNEFVDSIRSSNYPLATFICKKFAVSFNKALSLIASALKAYVEKEKEMDRELNETSSFNSINSMFPTFAVRFAIGALRGGGELVPVPVARKLLSLGNTSDIIFGRSSISKFRCDHKFDYISVISALSSVANDLV